MADIGRFPVSFDDEAFAEDIAHATTAGRNLAEQARAHLEREGLAPDDTRPCMADGPDGTRLPRCVKIYLLLPAGRWGLVLEVVRTEGKIRLEHRAFGVRHPSRPWHPSVYQVAHRRLHAAE